MRAILINPYDRTVTEQEHEDWELGALYEAIDCKLVDVVYIDGGDSTLWVDDEGYLTAGKPVFRFAGYPALLAGKALILGCTEDGSHMDCAISLDAVTKIVQWTELVTTGKMTAPVQRGNHFHLGQPLLDVRRQG